MIATQPRIRLTAKEYHRILTALVAADAECRTARAVCPVQARAAEQAIGELLAALAMPTGGWELSHADIAAANGVDVRFAG